MRIVACFKVVPDDQDILVNNDRTLDFSHAPATVSAYDLNAIEAGTRLVEEHGGELVALSVGAASVNDSKLRKNILSRGPDSLFLVADDTFAAMDAFNTASTLVAALEKLGEWDLLLCGDGSADIYAQQVGVQLGQLLGVPVLNGVSDIKLEDNHLVVARSLEFDIETYEVGLPAVLCVSSDINQPRIATMKQILAAGKKPVTLLSAAEIDFAPTPTTEWLETKAPVETDRRHEIIEGDSDDAIRQFIAKLTEIVR